MYEENELDSTCGVSDDELTKRFVKAIRINNEIKKIKGIPIQNTTMKRNNRVWSIRRSKGICLNAA